MGANSQTQCLLESILQVFKDLVSVYDGALREVLGEL